MRRVQICLFMFLAILIWSGCGDEEVARSDRVNSGDGEEVAADCDGDRCTCPDSLVVCSENCVDVTSHFDHCGGCGETCDNGEECVSGVCAPMECPEGLSACGGDCVDLSEDTQFCGDCERRCFDGEECVSGQCTCPSSQPECQDVGRQGEIVGGACEDNEACSGDSQCLVDGDFPEGTCSIECIEDDDCPGQTACVD